VANRCMADFDGERRCEWVQEARKDKAELVARGIGQRRHDGDEFRRRRDGLAVEQRGRKERAADVKLLRARATSRLRQRLREVDHMDGRVSTRARRREGGQMAHGGDAQANDCRCYCSCLTELLPPSLSLDSMLKLDNLL